MLRVSGGCDSITRKETSQTAVHSALKNTGKFGVGRLKGLSWTPSDQVVSSQLKLCDAAA